MITIDSQNFILKHRIAINELLLKNFKCFFVGLRVELIILHNFFENRIVIIQQQLAARLVPGQPFFCFEFNNSRLTIIDLLLLINFFLLECCV